MSNKFNEIDIQIRYISICTYTIECVDTPSWKDESNHGCDYYTSWCKNGAVESAFESLMGAHYNNPELNCCICGKDNQGMFYVTVGEVLRHSVRIKPPILFCQYKYLYNYQILSFTTRYLVRNGSATIEDRDFW